MRKYRLSKEGMNTLMKKLADLAQKSLDESSDGLNNIEITTNFVKKITKVTGMEDVIERNEQLSKTYRGFLDLYGFETMYDMYIYARSCDLLPEELKKSSACIPVTKTIIRNGKPLEVTVWERISKTNTIDQGSNNNKEKVSVRHARELKGTIIGEKESANPRNVAELKASAKNLSNGNDSFNDNSKYYLSLTDTDGSIVAIIGYSENDGNLTMDFYRSNGSFSGVASRGFAEMIKLAIKQKKGVVMEDIPQARTLFVKSGLQKNGNLWVASYDNLKDIYGEGGHVE